MVLCVTWFQLKNDGLVSRKAKKSYCNTINIKKPFFLSICESFVSFLNANCTLICNILATSNPAERDEICGVHSILQCREPLSWPQISVSNHKKRRDCGYWIMVFPKWTEQSSSRRMSIKTYLPSSFERWMKGNLNLFAEQKRLGWFWFTDSKFFDKFPENFWKSFFLLFN